MKKFWMIILFAFLATLIVVIVSNHLRSNTDDEEGWEQSVEAVVDTASEEKAKIEKPTTMFVDVKGEVMMPGVYEAEVTDRVLDLIELAGGFTEKAERNAVNLAQKIKDEMVIYVPAIGEAARNDFSGSESALVNINDANQSELETLPGIGPSKAQAIITYREEHGPFNSIEDLRSVSGIGEKSLEKLRELISIE